MGYKDRTSESFSVTSSGGGTITVSHNLVRNADTGTPNNRDKLITITPLDSAFAARDWYISSITNTQVIISGLANGTAYTFHMTAEHQDHRGNLLTE